MSHARLTRRTRYGFTLIELIVTVVILAILAALAVPALRAVQDRSRDEVLEAELEALGRGVAALAAFDGGGVTAAHVEEFLAGENAAAAALVTTSRWTLYADADSPAEPAGQDLLVAAADGYVGLATPAGHRAGQVAYAVVGTGGTVAQLTDATDPDTTNLAMRGADALCFYGVTAGCETLADDPVPGTSSSTDTTSDEPVAEEPVAEEPVASGPLPGSDHTIAFGATSNLYVRSVALADDGSSFVAGFFYGTATFGDLQVTSAGQNDGFVARVSPDGVVTDVVTAGGSAGDAAAGVAVDGTTVAVTGNFQPSTTGYTGWLAGKGNEGGNDAYVATFDTATLTPDKVAVTGGSSHEYGRGVAIDGATVGVTGDFLGSTTGYSGWLTGKTNQGNNDAFVATFDTATLTPDKVAVAGGTGYEYGYGVAVDGTTVAATGIFQSSTTGYTGWLAGEAHQAGYDAYVATFDTATLTLDKVAVAGGSDAVYGNGVAVDGTTVAVTGNFQPSTTGYTGWLAGEANQGSADAYVATFDTATLTPDKVAVAGGSGHEIGYGVAVDGTTIAATGFFSPSTTGYTGWLNVAANMGSADAYVATFDTATLTPDKVAVAGGSGSDIGYGVDLHGTTVAVGGHFQPSTVGYTGWLGGRTNDAYYDGFLHRYTLTP